MNRTPQGRGSQFAREARIGLTIIAVLVTVFIWFTYRRFSTSGESIADLRSEASQRQVSRPDPSAGTPDNPYGRNEIKNREPRTNQAAPKPASQPTPQLRGEHPANLPVFQANPGNSSTTAPAQGNLTLANPAHANPSSNQLPPQIASSFYKRGKDNVIPKKTPDNFSSKAGNDLRAQADNATEHKPGKRADSSEESLEVPVIELGQETSLEELDASNSSSPLDASSPIVKTEQVDTAVQPNEIPEDSAIVPNSIKPDSRMAASQLPAARSGNTTSIRAEMVSTAQDKTQTFFVENNDTYWSISQRAYGTGHYYKALYEYNKGHVREPDHLPVGQKIVAPPLDTLKSKYPHLIKEKGSINQTTYEQLDAAPPFQPRLADEEQLPQSWLPTHNDSEDAEPPHEPSAATELSESVQRAVESDQPTVESPSPAFPLQDKEAATRPGVTYAVREGDNLFDIARNELLQASRYLEILELNREHLPEDCTHLTPLPAGLKLKLPE